MVKLIYQVGVPTIVMQSIGSVMVYGMNRILVGFTETAATVFGVYFKLQSFFFMPVFGLNNAMVPIVAYNYGARRPERIMETIKLSLKVALCFMLLGIALFQLMPGTLLKLFQASENMLGIGSTALRIISFHYFFAGFCIIAISVFQALNKAMFSLVVSIIRQLVVLLPAAWLLSRTGVLAAVWWSFPIAEFVAVCMCAVFMKRTYDTQVKGLAG